MSQLVNGTYTGDVDTKIPTETLIISTRVATDAVAVVPIGTLPGAGMQVVVTRVIFRGSSTSNAATAATLRVTNLAGSQTNLASFVATDGPANGNLALVIQTGTQVGTTPKTKDLPIAQSGGTLDLNVTTASGVAGSRIGVDVLGFWVMA